MRPLAASDGHDAPSLIDELVPGFAAVVEDVLVRGEDAVREPVFAHELPDVLDRVQFGAFRWQRDDADVFRYIQLVGDVPACLIHQDHSMGAGLNGERYLREMKAHGLGVAERQNQPCAFAQLGANRAEDID